MAVHRPNDNSPGCNGVGALWVECYRVVTMSGATKELIAAGHALAKTIHCPESSALVKELAAQLDVHRVRADVLAVEGAGLKNFINTECFVAEPGMPGEYDYVSSQVPVTPATDAAIAEFKAQGMDEFADDCDSDVMLVEPEDTEHYELMAEHAREFAAQLRKEAK